MKYLLAIDQGTSSTRAMLYTQSGQLVTMSQHPLTQSYPKAGWVEHCPEEIWSKTLMAIKEVASHTDIKNIIACGITNQRETTLIWDKQTGKCLYPAIVWQDRRTENFCESLNGYSKMIKEKTGLRPDPYFSASKLHWLLTTIPEASILAEQNQLAFGTIDTFLLWRLTKGSSHCTDVTNASRTLLYNILSEQWDDDLLKLFNVPAGILPKVCASDASFGRIDSEFLGTSIPITGIAGDQQAALIGQCCFDKGMTKATFGTGGFLLMNTGDAAVLSNHNLLTTIAYKINNQTSYGLEGSLYHAGTTIKWLRDEMKLITSSAESEHLAASLSNNEGVYLVPSFTGLGAPHWISSPGAIITGLSRKSNAAHFARAALESVAYQTREVMDCMREDSGITMSGLRVDGGMTVNHWFLQFLSSQCKVTVQKPHDIETTALGAAMLAALGCGDRSSLSSFQKNWKVEREVMPEQNEASRERNFAGWLQAVRMLKASSE
ncbi:MAG: glycerol kinase GlpK [Legionella sp.]|nr:glycerol kinase GlpK [Legionella sp.]